MDHDTVSLTFGYELELVVRCNTVFNATGYRGNEKEVFTYFANLLTENGCKAEAYLPTSTRSCPDYTKWNITNDSTIVEETASMQGSRVDRHFRVAMELVSPIFRVRDDWENAIQIAMASVSLPDVRSNSTTGLHVHIGLEQRDLNVVELKRIAQFVIIFECEFLFLYCI